jgi:hypothetical protein
MFCMCRTSGEAAGPVRRDAEVHNDGEQTEPGAPVLRYRPKERGCIYLLLYCYGHSQVETNSSLLSGAYKEMSSILADQ